MWCRALLKELLYAAKQVTWYFENDGV